MAKGKIAEGDEVNLRAKIARIWPDGQITVSIKSASVTDRVTLLNDNDIIETFSEGSRAVPLSASGWSSRLDSADMFGLRRDHLTPCR